MERGNRYVAPYDESSLFIKCLEKIAFSYLPLNTSHFRQKFVAVLQNVVKVGTYDLNWLKIFYRTR